MDLEEVLLAVDGVAVEGDGDLDAMSGDTVVPGGGGGDAGDDAVGEVREGGGDVGAEGGDAGGITGLEGDGDRGVGLVGLARG